MTKGLRGVGVYIRIVGRLLPRFLPHFMILLHIFSCPPFRESSGLWGPGIRTGTGKDRGSPPRQ